MTNQGDRQADARSSTGTTLTYEGDTLAYFDSQSIAAGEYNGRLLAWINQALGTSYTEINGAKTALANNVSIPTWDGLGLLGGAGVVYNPASLAIFASFTTPPTTARKILINNLVTSLFSSGVWAKLNCLWVTAANDSQAALKNWIAPGTNDLIVSGAAVFTANSGYAGDGGTGHLAGPNPSAAGAPITQNSAHYGVWLNSNIAEDNGELGGGSGFIRARTSANLVQGRLNDGTTTTLFSSITDGRGHTLTSRAASGSYTPYKNGVAGSLASVASTTLNATFNVCATNTTNAGTAIVGASHFGGALTGADAATFYSVLLAYMQGIGAA